MITLVQHETPSSSSSSEEDSNYEYCETDKSVKRIQNRTKKDVNGIEVTLSTDNKQNRKKSKRKEHPCPHCEKTFPFPNKLREHIEIHTTERYQCTECPSPKKFDKFNDLKSHRKQYHSRASHKCSLCHYSNSRPAFIKRHFQLNHIDGVPCTIAGCSMKVAKNRLKTHIKEMHTTPIELSLTPIRAKLSFHKCPNCGYEPNQSIIDAEEQYKDLMAHMEAMHEKKKRKECKFGCGASLQHEEERNHQDICSKLKPDESCSSTSKLNDDNCCYTNTVTSQSMLSEISDNEIEVGQESAESLTNCLNEELEEEEKDKGNSSKEPPRKKSKKYENQLKTEFTCEICGKGSLSRDSLRKHVWSCHSGPKKELKKQFECDRKSMIDGEDVCGKSFRTEQSLHDHYNVHDGIKPYACKSCDQRFYSRDRFAVHLSKYHQTSIKNYKFV